MLPLPEPKPNGSIQDLAPFINYGKRETFGLLAGWLVGIFSRGPYAHIVLHGEKGSAKSSVMKYLCCIVDPSVKVLRGLPKDYHSLAIAARNAHIFTCDNVSRLNTQQSDILCRLSTGDTFVTRRLYSDDSENILKLQRPAIINGISDLVVSGDLLERTVILTLPTIKPEERRDIADMDSEFAKVHPRILGAVLSAVSVALRNLPNVTLEAKPRLVDFVRFIEAAAPALHWKPTAYVTAFINNQKENARSELEASLFGLTLVEELSRRRLEEVSGRAQDFWVELSDLVKDKLTRNSNWPRSPSAMSAELKRIAPLLRELGWDVEWTHNNVGDKIITVRRGGIPNSSD
jgi:hypothetical protein